MNARETIISNLSTIIEKLFGEKVEINLEIPEDISHGDYSCNIALQLSKKLGKSPRDIAEEIKERLNTEYSILDTVEKVEVAGPGFINFYLSTFMVFLSKLMSFSKIEGEHSLNLPILQI